MSKLNALIKKNAYNVSVPRSQGYSDSTIEMYLNMQEKLKKKNIKTREDFKQFYATTAKPLFDRMQNEQDQNQKKPQQGQQQQQQMPDRKQIQQIIDKFKSKSTATPAQGPTTTAPQSGTTIAKGSKTALQGTKAATTATTKGGAAAAKGSTAAIATPTTTATGAVTPAATTGTGVATGTGTGAAATTTGATGGSSAAGGAAAGGMGAAAIAGIVALGIGVQHLASNNTDTVFEGVETDDAFEGHFGTEPWLAYTHDKLGLDPTAGEKFDAAVKNDDWDTAAQRLPAVLDYWANPGRTWLRTGLEAAGMDMDEDWVKWLDPTEALFDWIGGD